MLADKDSLLPFLKKGVTQVAWVVEDLDKAVKQFYDNFGIGPWHYYRYGSPLLKMMRRRGKDTSYCMRTAVADAGITRLELIQPISGDTIFHEFVAKNGYGKVQHFQETAVCKQSLQNKRFLVTDNIESANIPETGEVLDLRDGIPECRALHLACGTNGVYLPVPVSYSSSYPIQPGRI